MINYKDINQKKIPVMLEDFQNPLKVFHHLDRVHELQQTGDTTPVHLTIGFTNYCNHKCSWCYINWHQAGKLSDRSGTTNEKSLKAVNADNRLIEAVGEARQMGLKSVTIVGDGEPTMHPKFVFMLDKLGEMGLDVGIFTNMSARKTSVIDSLIKNCFFVRCSIDAASPETHAAMHGTDDFARVIENLRYLVEKRANNPSLTIGVQFVVNHHNYKELPSAAAFYRDIGVDYFTAKPAYKNVLNPDHEENALSFEKILPLLQAAKEYETETYKVYVKVSQFLETLQHETNDGRYYQKCLATPFSPYLDEDGSVEMCGNLKGRGFTMGNINDASFSEIWASALRKKCIDDIDLFKCPSGCRLDPLNKVLWDALEPNDEKVHKNFL